MSRIGAAVIGLGVGRAHADAYAADPRCDLVAVCDLDAGRLDEAIRRFPGVRVTDQAEALIDDPAIDAVSIATYDDLHFGQAARALERGKHVFVEKPLCRSIDELRELRRLVAAAGTVLASNLVLREAPLYRWLRDAVIGGELGRLFAFDGDYLYGRVEKITEGWRKDVVGYSVMLGGGIHLVDLMLWITGERPSSAVAVGGHVATAGTAFRYEDEIAATYRFASGLVGRITANFGCVHPHQHVVRAFGTAATFLYDDLGPRLRVSRDPAAPHRSLDLDPQPASKSVLVSRFVDEISAGRAGLSGAQREFDVISVCLAADRSLRSGKEVEVVYV